jgi:hypothetical protein
MQRDVPGAVKYAEGQIARLLSGRVELWELVMTGGLWRVTGQQLEKAAAAAGKQECSLPVHCSQLQLAACRGTVGACHDWGAVEGDGAAARKGGSCSR